MKPSSKSYLPLVFVLVLISVFLVGCPKQTKPTQPEVKTDSTAVTKEEPSKPAPEPPKKEAPSPPTVTEPSKKETPATSELPRKEVPAPPSPSAATSPPSASAQVETKEPAERTTEIALSSVNFREGPSMSHRITRVLKKKTKLIILEEKEEWLRVRLEDGAEGWVGKAMTTEGREPSPATPPKGKK